MTFEEEYADVLQNIEAGIVTVYRQYPDLSDHEAVRALEPLLRRYKAEKTGRVPEKISLSEREQYISNNVLNMCEWRLGRASVLGAGAGEKITKPLNVDEVILCLKRVLKSVEKLNKLNGWQGYLKFVSNYVK